MSLLDDAAIKDFEKHLYSGLLAIFCFVTLKLGLVYLFRTSSTQEKGKHDEKALCKFVGNLLFILAGILILIEVARRFYLSYSTHIMFIGFIFIVLVIIIAVI